MGVGIPNWERARRDMAGQIIRLLSCPTCGSEDIAVQCLLDRDGFPPGQPEHAITYSHVALVFCGACRGGHVEDLRHDCFDIEDVFDEYEWYVLDSSDMSRLSGLLEGCPLPLEPDCTCSVHCSLRASCRELPKEPWSTGLEGARHVRQVTLIIDQGRPSLNLK